MTDPNPIIICGSRTWTDPAPIRKLLESIQAKVDNPTIIHGAAKGADRIAGEEAQKLGMDVVAYPADWDKHGKSAGMIRNKLMLEHPGVTHVIAFKVGAPSKGTDNMLKISREAGMYTGVYTQPEHSA